ncbi:unnamed protein product [Blepharisma stoltei]|uniref:Uncharacterized protein n=1 Tax=Blepharisma stoltei TaxID=1481888 RepID=A0AAU9JQ68_9CILI|nr:unnamed protein product [Blepharisma stoltei]
MCLIPDNSIFCCGYYPTPKKSAFIIQPNKMLKHVADTPFSIGLSGSIYYNDSVYVFGGSTTSGIWSGAFKYYLWEDKWANLNPMPLKSTFVSCIAKNNKILLSGREHTKIYCYDIIQNSYNELHNIQQGQWRKIICENNKNAYVIEAGGHIYEGNQEWKAWRTIGNSGIISKELIGCKVLWENSAYFCFEGYDLYEFNMKEKKCKKIDILY